MKLFSDKSEVSQNKCCLFYFLSFLAERGVEVVLLLPGIPDKTTPYALAKTHYASLLESGVKIYEYTPGFVHAKVFVSDTRDSVSFSSIPHICKNINVKLFTASPFNITAVSFQCPCFVTYFPLGEKKFEEMLKQLETAEHFIFLEYFIVDEGLMWGKILDL